MEKCIGCGIEGQFHLNLEEVNNALINLGNDVDEVYHSLLLENCRGELYNMQSCPIAVYLKKRDLLPDTAFVKYGRIEEHSHHSAKYVTLPGAIRDFIRMFDRGSYPELINGFWTRTWSRIKRFLGVW